MVKWAQVDWLGHANGGAVETSSAVNAVVQADSVLTGWANNRVILNAVGLLISASVVIVGLAGASNGHGARLEAVEVDGAQDGLGLAFIVAVVASGAGITHEVASVVVVGGDGAKLAVSSTGSTQHVVVGALGAVLRVLAGADGAVVANGALSAAEGL